MPLASRLHTYPKIFNRKGNLKVLPLRKPLGIQTRYVFLASTGLLSMVYAYQ